MRTLNMRLRYKGPPKIPTKEEIIARDIKYVLRKIKTGDFDIEKKSHSIKAKFALRAGLLELDNQGNYKLKEEL